MSTRVYRIAAPGQLKCLQEYATSGQLIPFARVWNSELKRTGNKSTAWDKKFYVLFEADKEIRYRRASVVRITDRQTTEECAVLRYNLSMKWCSEFLDEVEEGDHDRGWC